ncbi:hypothetical protein EG329_011502 [Mollisiaceae sp. DMI_Dod_QoI]|nr:hypothetical protein EG329_011502 [Helotiales sp. DMI_Dod_QoI]
MSYSTPASATGDSESSQLVTKAGDQHTSKRRRLEHPTFADTGSSVKLLVGEQLVEVTVLKEVACLRSPVLKAAFCGSFIESQTQAYKLCHVNKATARMLVQWLYTQDLEINQMKDDWMPTDGAGDEECINLAKLWILADELGIPRLQNTVVETINDASAKWNLVNTSMVRTIYAGTQDDSPLRRFIVALCYYFLPGELYKKYTVHFPYHMLVDLAVFGAVDSNNDVFEVSDYFVDEG